MRLDRMKINQPCWMMTAAPGLVECRLVNISETHAVVLLPDQVKLPQKCDLYFRADAKVGRCCYVIRQTGDKADLAIIGRIGSDALLSKELFQV